MKNTKEQDEEPKFRYKVGVSTPERVFFYIFALAFVIFFSVIGVECAREDGIEAAGWVFLLAWGAGWLLVESTNSHVAVYKGRVVVKKIFSKKEYPLCEFGEPKKDADLVYTGRRYKWVGTHVYYDSNGKKLFKVYAAWENSDKFYKEIKQRYSQIQSCQKAKNTKEKALKHKSRKA